MSSHEHAPLTADEHSKFIEMADNNTDLWEAPDSLDSKTANRLISLSNILYAKNYLKGEKSKSAGEKYGFASQPIAFSISRDNAINLLNREVPNFYMKFNVLPGDGNDEITYIILCENEEDISADRMFAVFGAKNVGGDKVSFIKDGERVDWPGLIEWTVAKLMQGKPPTK